MWNDMDRWYTKNTDPHSVRSEAENYVAYVPDESIARLIAEAPAMYSIVQALAGNSRTIHPKVLGRLAAALVDRVELGHDTDDVA